RIEVVVVRLCLCVRTTDQRHCRQNAEAPSAGSREAHRPRIHEGAIWISAHEFRSDDGGETLAGRSPVLLLASARGTAGAVPPIVARPVAAYPLAVRPITVRPIAVRPIAIAERGQLVHHENHPLHVPRTDDQP